jgi:hypothetical protein
MRFPFTALSSQKGDSAFMPFLPVSLQIGSQVVLSHGLLDTGATVNVLPFSTGLALGAVWEEQTMPLRLGGNLAAYEARILFVKTLIEDCPPAELAFAWTRADNIPLLLGQTNFFMEFDVFFSRSGLYFEVTPKG